MASSATLWMWPVILLFAGSTYSQDITGCRFPGAPAHSSVFFSDERLVAGAVATYACERGFELLGPSRRVCGEDGRWSPEGIPFCVLNVAAGKAPMQISTDQGGVPQKAIDGSTSSFFSADTCTLTKPERVPWWYVNLLEPYMVQLVRLDFGNNQEATIVVRVGNNRPDLGTNPICNRFSGSLEEGKPLFLPCNPPMPGAFVSVHLEDAGGSSRLSVCEAFVYTDQALPIERCPQFRDQPPGSTATYNGKCYIFYNRQPLTFKDSLSFCKSRGGTLVDESNPALQGFISWELWRRHRSDTTSQYWMGAVRDPQDRNNWKWISGEDVSVSFWNLPGGNENCARFDGSKGWLWSDTNCNTNLNFICQHQPKACGRPEQPPNSTMIAKNFNVGSAIEYNCDEGHLLVGPALRTCLPTGFYNEFPPVCKRIECGFPAEIPNGFYQLVNGTVGYLSQVVYSCEEGYEMTGRAQLMCDIDERWNGPPPRCQPVECGEPPAIAHGRFAVRDNATTTAGAVVEYSCVSPATHRLVGPRTITCLPSGLYDKEPPACKEEAKAAGVAPGPSPGKQPAAAGRTPQKPGVASSPAPPARPGRRPDSAAEGSARLPGLAAVPPPPLPPPSSPPPPPQEENEIPDGANRRADPGEERREAVGARLNLGAIIALGVFGGFVFLAAIITTVVILIRSGEKCKDLPPPHSVPPRWYTLLALPFPDQQVGRREFSRSYRNRAGYFSNSH
ncbi:sushi, von Willebrand factor type A, EGF and pentraxin domain-containing protein 1 isoform X2 [Bacillus rossius redtenbacheri]|uniref:sushi, von Willebrand factor type A, EGF and pentraxin domain-containing protein 1 isoform X2 n=1 Tax=Bacillus rossius redtenbacheri TaxID=93214 RepID=UPI002FDE3155